MAEALKKVVGETAASLIEATAKNIGLGTGSTAAYFVKALASRGLGAVCVSTSVATENLAKEVGLNVVDLNKVDSIDVAVDGADEIDEDMNLTKGAGAALFREKMVEILAKEFIVIADESKLVKKLGEKFSIPVEIVPFGYVTTVARIRELGGNPVVRVKPNTEEKVVTDNGNYLADVKFAPIEDPASLAQRLKGIVGVVDHGIFPGMATKCLVAMKDGRVLVMERDKASGKVVQSYLNH